ncbi:MAG: hypothetical protein CMG71_00910 [Candidatus Marinimicrobia bacterium]|nr:hypothetical protein [Candidatus Neomarinimicrobiota bacterium]|tara:strand:+ start:51117 stop:52076 length:960 start_codon:yes stop_codon:yes gene_type:complete
MIDLSDELTVFIVSAGEDTYNDCEQALSNQDCVFRIKHIKDVFPMSNAFQAMPDNCETKYFVQVDADMILYPNSISTLYKEIQRSSPLTYMVTGSLQEKGFGIRGHVKCWKKSVFRWFSFRDVRTVDRDLYKRLRYFALRQKNLSKVLGEHIPRHSSFSSYLKSKGDIEKWRFLKRSPVRGEKTSYLAIIPRKKLRLCAMDNLLEFLEGYPDSKHQLLGTLLGALTHEERFRRSKDMNYEKILFDKVLHVFQQSGDFPHISTSLNGNVQIKDLFVECYYHSKNLSPEIRKDLAYGIMRIYCPRIASAESASDLLRLLDK